MLDGLDGLDEAALARQLRVPRVVLLDVVSSTMDDAHQRAASGAAAGTCVVADAQSAGRGRGGHAWLSERGAGLWCTIIERPDSAAGLDVLSVRIGLAAAPVLEAFTGAPVQLKWPNDLFVGGAKLAGILVEARWRQGNVEWLAIGIGVNLRPPAAMATAGCLRAGTRRSDVLRALVPPLRRAAAVRGPLSSAERAEYASRDLSVGRRCLEPAAGIVRGLTDDGSLVIVTGAGESHFRGGSLVLAEDT